MGKRPVTMIIMDGWGYRNEEHGNATKIAKTPWLDKICTKYPHTLIQASQKWVGLPDGQMGNSEVGHLNLGAGRIVYQDFTRISNAIADKTFFTNKTILNTIEKLKKDNGALHLLGLVSNGGVHSHLEHLYALLQLASQQNIHRIFIHAFMDGRDTSPKSGAGYLNDLQNVINKTGVGAIASVCGRFYAMDRDTRWNRIQKAYDMLVLSKGRKRHDPVALMQECYIGDETDEFIKPTVIVDNHEKSIGQIKDNDAIIFFNFRADRARELTRAFTEKGFSGFSLTKRPLLSSYITMTEYDANFALPLVFPPCSMDNILGEIISKNGLFQVRIAETEKYAHVTFFFNGGREEPFPNEERRLIPSPRDVRTYDLKPEMSAVKIMEKVLDELNTKHYDFIVVNFANGDMVGHTGFLDATVKACEVIDKCVGRIVEQNLKQDGITIITADHGNAEEMIDKNGGPNTAHTINPVPFILVDNKRIGTRLKPDGKLADVGPTILSLMGLDIPMEMTGESLIIDNP